jgi:adhesin/invasin
VLTVVGAGTATISVAGAETDYRLAPATQTYTVIIEKDEPELSLSGAAEITITQGEAFTEPTLTNPHSVTPVTYTSSRTDVATVDVQTGKVTVVKPGTTEISASFAGNTNYKTDKATYQLTVKPQNGDANADGTVDVSDVVAVVNHILDRSSANFDTEAADANNDGTIDVSDVVAIVNIILRK